MNSPPPWEPDRILTRGAASALIRASFPAIDSEGLKYLGSGWEFDAYLTTDGWVFRFPRREEYADLFVQERRVHLLVSAVLPSSVAVPLVELVGQPGMGFPYEFAGHRLIPGVPADAIDDPDLLPVLAHDIGVALGAIHSISEEAARPAGIGEMGVDELATKFGWVEAAFALRGLDPAVDLALEWLREIPLPTAGSERWTPSESISVPFQGQLRLIHADVGVDHLIVNPMTGRLAGILDWTDSRLGDPAGDFVFAVTWKGWSFAEEVFRNYPHQIDRAFRERLAFISRLLSIMYLTLAHLQHFDVASGIRGVRNAFAPAGAS